MLLYLGAVSPLGSPLSRGCVSILSIFLCFFSKPRYCFAKLGGVLFLDSPILAVLLHLCQVCLCLRGRIVCHVGEQLSEKVTQRRVFLTEKLQTG